MMWAEALRGVEKVLSWRTEQWTISGLYEGVPDVRVTPPSAKRPDLCACLPSPLARVLA